MSEFGGALLLHCVLIRLLLSQWQLSNAVLPQCKHRIISLLLTPNIRCLLRLCPVL